MESFVQWIYNGILSPKESQWNPLYNGFTTDFFVQTNRNRILDISFLMILVYKGITMQFFVQWISSGFLCTKESQWNLLYKGITTESFAQGNCKGNVMTVNEREIMIANEGEVMIPNEREVMIVNEGKRHECQRR